MAASSTPRATRSAPNSPPSSSPRCCRPSLESLNYVEGRPPRGPTEASIDKAAADEAGLSWATDQAGRPQRRVSFRLVGFTQLGNASFGGASIAQVTLPEAQRITGKEGRFDQISIAADEGVTPLR